MNDLKELCTRFSEAGRLDAIFVRPQRRLPVETRSSAMLLAGQGVEGDYRIGARSGGKRQLSLIQHEHLAVIAAFSTLATIDPAILRRNLLISGLNLLAAKTLFKDRPLVLQIGPEALVALTIPCDPCSQMEALLGYGGYSAMRGHGGMCARILRSGPIAIGDPVRCIPMPPELQDEAAIGAASAASSLF